MSRSRPRSRLRPLVVRAVLAVLAWAIVVATRLRDPRVRLLLLGTLATLPAVVATITLSQASRNVTAFLLLTCIAVGVATSEVWTPLGAAGSGGRSTGSIARSQAGSPVPRCAVMLVALALVGQVSVRPAVGDSLSSATADMLRPRLGPGDDVVSTFRGRSTLGIELFDQQTLIVLLPAQAVDDARSIGISLARRTTRDVVRHRARSLAGSGRGAGSSVSRDRAAARAQPGGAGLGAARTTGPGRRSHRGEARSRARSGVVPVRQRTDWAGAMAGSRSTLLPMRSFCGSIRPGRGASLRPWLGFLRARR